MIGVPRQGSGNVLSRNFLRMHLRTGHSGAVGQQDISWKSGASFSFLETPRRAPQSLTRWSSYLPPWFSYLFPKGMTRAFALPWRQTIALSMRLAAKKCAGSVPATFHLEGRGVVGRSAHTTFADVVRTTAADASVAADDVRHQPLRTLFAPQPSPFFERLLYTCLFMASFTFD